MKILLVAIFIVMYLSPSIYAADDITPSNEDVCDVLLDSTPGLYGLCLGFCEAKDITDETVPISEAEANALLVTVPSGSMLKAYNAKKGEGDPDMPCIEVEAACPCWSNEELDKWTDDEGTYNTHCVYYNGSDHYGALLSVLPPQESVHSSVQTIKHTHIGNDGDDHCRLLIKRPDEGVPNFLRLLSVNEEEFNACNSQIRERAEQMGYSCGIGQ